MNTVVLTITGLFYCFWGYALLDRLPCDLTFEYDLFFISGIALLGLFYLHLERQLNRLYRPVQKQGDKDGVEESKRKQQEVFE